MKISTYHAFCRNLLLDNTTSTGLGMRGRILDRPVFLVWGVQNIDKFGFDNHIEIGMILLSILVVIVLFFAFGPKHTLLIPDIAWSIDTVLFIRKTRKAKKDNETWGDDTVKKIDDPHKYT